MRISYGDAVATRGKVTIAHVIDHVACAFELSIADITGPCRERRLACARFASAWLAHRHTGKTLVQIGRVIGGRDHSTIRHEIRRAKELIGTDKGFASLLDRLDSQLVSA